MHPINQCRKQDLPGDQVDRAILYASLELSRANWLATSLAPNNDKISKHMTAGVMDPDYLRCWDACGKEPKG